MKQGYFQCYGLLASQPPPLHVEKKSLRFIGKKCVAPKKVVIVLNLELPDILNV